jgi:hypothetical protein
MLGKGIPSAVCANHLLPAGFVLPWPQATEEPLYSGLQSLNRVFHLTYILPFTTGGSTTKRGSVCNACSSVAHAIHPMRGIGRLRVAEQGRIGAGCVCPSGRPARRLGGGGPGQAGAPNSPQRLTFSIFTEFFAGIVSITNCSSGIFNIDPGALYLEIG